jgi:glycerol-3-phosphate acyltransferase PlsX
VGVLRGVDRPAIAAVLPNLKGHSVLLDVGANVDPKPWHLFQFAVMGNVYARDILGMERPRVGLLSVGEEEGKGNELTKEAYEQLKDSSLNFLGNVEGRDIYNGTCDVVVTDGFTGNVALKISESLAEMVMAMIREELTRDARSKVAAALARPAFQRFKKRVDYAEMGGAPLLGIDGGAIICHGASPVKAIKNAVRVATEWAKAGLNDHIRAALENEIARGNRDEGGRG